MPPLVGKSGGMPTFLTPSLRRLRFLMAALAVQTTGVVVFLFGLKKGVLTTVAGTR